MKQDSDDLKLEDVINDLGNLYLKTQDDKGCELFLSKTMMNIKQLYDHVANKCEYYDLSTYKKILETCARISKIFQENPKLSAVQRAMIQRLAKTLSDLILQKE